MKITHKSNVIPFKEIPVGEIFKLPDSEDIFIKIARHNAEGCCVFNVTTGEKRDLYGGKDVIPLKTELIIYQ